MLKEHMHDERHAGLGGALEHSCQIGKEALMIEVGVAVCTGKGQTKALRKRSLSFLFRHF
jgi:hypothetical protein